jgi:glycosyltransferase involved in cell wall biosynthesis
MFFYTSPKLSIIFIHSHVLSHRSLEVFKEDYFEKSENNIIFISFSWYYPREKYYIKEAIESGIIPLGNFYVLLNSPEELEIFKNDFPKCNSYLINNAAFIDDGNFNWNPNIIKKYDAIMNAKAESFKNHLLSKDIENLCLVMNGEKDEIEKIKLEVQPSFCNDSMLIYGQIAYLINESYVSLILSEEEGACYASAEYLSCGSPVVSIKSRGGRHVFYNDNNSIICEANTTSVAEAVLEAKKKVENGEFSSELIRNDFLKKAYEHRQRFVDMLQSIFDKFNIEEDAKIYFDSVYYTKFGANRISI